MMLKPLDSALKGQNFSLLRQDFIERVISTQGNDLREA